MIVAAWLALYGAAMLAAAPPLLRRLSRGGHAPRFAIIVWLTAIGSVLLCWPTAALLVAVEFGEHTTTPEGVVATCLEAARNIMAGGAGVAAQAVAWLFLILGAAAPVLVTARVTRIVATMRARAHEHADAVRIVGRCHAGDVVVVQAEQPMAYCVQGRPSAIVVTSAALSALDADQLSAVLAHERAHLAGRHATVVGLLRALAAVLPRLALFTDGAAQVSTLLEMRADDVAVRRHGRPTLLGGLLALSGVTPGPALAAAGHDVVARAHRLARTDALPATRARVQASLWVAMLCSAAGPASIAALAFTGALLCTP